MPIHVDLTRLPLVVCTFEGASSDAEFVEYLDALTVIAGRARKTAVVLDLTQSTPAPASQRKLQTDWLKQHERELGERSVGTAFCFSSSIFRFVLSGLLMTQKMPTPYAVCSTRKEAVRWATDQLREAGVAI